MGGREGVKGECKTDIRSRVKSNSKWSPHYNLLTADRDSREEPDLRYPDWDR